MKITYHDGYVSNDELGPFFDAVAEEKNDSEEMDDEEADGENLQPEMDTPVPEVPSLSEADVKKMSTKELKDELKKRKLSTNGKKDVLQG